MQDVKAGWFGLSLTGLILVVVIAIGCLLSLGGVIWYRFIEPKREAARRVVFEETRSYNQGKIQQLAKYREEYQRADADEKAVIASTIKHQFADFQIDHLPEGLQVFLRSVRGY